jgi:hypothetical protein
MSLVKTQFTTMVGDPRRQCCRNVVLTQSNDVSRTMHELFGDRRVENMHATYQVQSCVRARHLARSSARLVSHYLGIQRLSSRQLKTQGTKCHTDRSKPIAGLSGVTTLSHAFQEHQTEPNFQAPSTKVITTQQNNHVVC